MFNTHLSGEREAPWWVIAAPAIGVPVMVALLALTAPKHETPLHGAEGDTTTEQVERQAIDYAFDCTARPSSS